MKGKAPQSKKSGIKPKPKSGLQRQDQGHRAQFDQLLDDAIFGVPAKPKKRR